MPQFDRIIDITDLYPTLEDSFQRKHLTPEEIAEVDYPWNPRLGGHSGTPRVAWGVLDDFEGRVWVTQFHVVPRERFERLLRRGRDNHRFR